MSKYCRRPDSAGRLFPGDSRLGTGVITVELDFHLNVISDMTIKASDEADDAAKVAYAHTTQHNVFHYPLLAYHFLD